MQQEPNKMKPNQKDELKRRLIMSLSGNCGGEI